jgi:hypothetical protein
MNNKWTVSLSIESARDTPVKHKFHAFIYAVIFPRAILRKGVLAGEQAVTRWRSRCECTSAQKETYARKKASRASQWIALIQAIIEIGLSWRAFAYCFTLFARVRSRSRELKPPLLFPERENP